MCTLIAKVESGFRSILSQENKILNQLNTDNIDAVEFNPSYKLEDDEWFFISGFSKKKIL